MNVQLLIDNADLPATSGASFVRQGPVAGLAVTHAAAAGPEDARRAADSAGAAFPGWSATAPNSRRAILLKARDLTATRATDFATVMTRETGATAPWGQFNVSLAAGILREAACSVTHITGEVIPSDKPGCLSLAIRQPAGVCVGIAPWNAPVILGTCAIAMAIACGNTAVLKASELCPTPTV